MYVIRGSIQQGKGLRHYRYTIHLEQSLVELFKLYEEMGGAAPHAEAVIDERIDRCLSEARAPRALVQSHLHALRRAKDLHHYLMTEPELTSVKLRLLEHVLFHRTPEARWAAVRELLVEQIDLIAETPLPGIAGNGERYKQQLSLRGSRLGQMLVTVALFNFDLCDEEPPPNLTVRFRARRFPEHLWEGAPGQGRDARSAWTLSDWAPQHPLCRWEYLAADLAHALFRAPRAAAVQADPAWRGWAAPHPAYGGAQEGATPPTRLYCRVGECFAEPGAARQLELFPASPDALLLELQRLVHRQHGSDGLQALAVLLARLDRSGPGEAVTIALEEMASEAFGEARAARTLRARLAKVRAVLERMTEVECLRVHEDGAGGMLRSGRLLTVIGRAERLADGELPGAPSPAEAGPAGAGSLEPRWTVLLDPLFYRPGGATLGEPFRDLPRALFAQKAKRHPYLLALFVYLRRAWAREESGTVELSARQLFHECGLWLKESSPYRAVELLKRELAHMKEAGWLGRWRLYPAGRRDPLEDRYRLEAPRAAVGRGGARLRPDLNGLQTMPAMEKDVLALQEGWT